MRRVSYQFPNRCDLEFEADVHFPVFLNAVESLAGRQDNFRTERGPIKREISVLLANDRLGFEKIEQGSQMSKIATDAADIVVILTDTVLKASGNVPLNDHRFMIRTIEKGDRTEVFITKSPSIEGFDSMDMKKMILEALS
ncbi:hypothetical protein [Methanorbis rubei]|uniref:Uncharacterized protein n=1 Tax=Methanorbis rubei TaxID=3028300 RepID=A0AAE4MG20_9EURY|nr:hypothetical protein [Methanocorpusculaceae archaeon Cs1]